MTLDALFERARIWRGGETPSAIGAVVPTGIAELDALLPGGGWPRGALSEILTAEGHGALSLLMPMLARLNDEARLIVFVAPPYLPYAPALIEHGINLAQVLCISPRDDTTDVPAPSGRLLKKSSRDAAQGETVRESGVFQRPAGETSPRHTREGRYPAGNDSHHLADRLWALEQCLKSGACAAVLSWFAQPPVQHLRRLQLAAGNGDCLACFFYPPDIREHTTPATLRIAVARIDSALSVRILKRRGGWPCAPIILSKNKEG